MRKVTFIGLDVHKETISIAAAEKDSREIYFVGTIPNEKHAIKKKLLQMSKKMGTLEFVYEAGPCGYGLYRLLRSLGYSCIIVAPSNIPGISNNKIKNDHRDAKHLARLLRMGELDSIWIPDELHEAIRELVRARHATRKDIKKSKQRVQSFLLKQELKYEGKAWTHRHKVWLRDLTFDFPGLNMAFQTYLNDVDRVEKSIETIENQLRELCEDWALKDLVIALQALKGIGFIIAISFVCEVGDPARFPHPRNLMAYLGLIPGEYSSGNKTRGKGITKTGNPNLRSLLYEAAWNYSKTPKIGQYMKKHVPKEAPGFAIDISWKAQLRLHKKYKKLIARGKISQKAITAVARELLGFIWAICIQININNQVALKQT